MAVLNILQQKSKLLQLEDHLIHLISLSDDDDFASQKEDMVKDQLETNLTEKNCMVLRNSDHELLMITN